MAQPPLTSALAWQAAKAFSWWLRGRQQAWECKCLRCWSCNSFLCSSENRLPHKMWHKTNLLSFTARDQRPKIDFISVIRGVGRTAFCPEAPGENASSPMASNIFKDCSAASPTWFCFQFHITFFLIFWPCSLFTKMLVIVRGPVGWLKITSFSDLYYICKIPSTMLGHVITDSGKQNWSISGREGASSLLYRLNFICQNQHMWLRWLPIFLTIIWSIQYQAIPLVVFTEYIETMVSEMQLFKAS